jgi:hypothetical protein
MDACESTRFATTPAPESTRPTSVSPANWPARIILRVTGRFKSRPAGAEDDGHTAAGDLAGDPVIAEAADAPERELGRHHSITAAE